MNNRDSSNPINLLITKRGLRQVYGDESALVILRKVRNDLGSSAV